MDLPEHVNATSGAILGAAIEVHITLGPGLLESACRDCLAHELELRGRVVCREVPMPLHYKGLAVPTASRADLVVDGAVVAELKTAADFTPTDEANA